MDIHPLRWLIMQSFKNSRYIHFLISISLFTSVSIGCKQQNAPKTTGKGMRIVCMSPAISQMISDLGESGLLVGVHQRDEFVGKAGIEAVGDNVQLDYEKLIRLKPTHVILQKLKTGVPEKLKGFAEKYGWSIHEFEIDTLDDVWETLVGEGEQKGLGDILKVGEKAKRLVSELRGQLESVSRVGGKLEGDGRLKVLMLVYTSPMTAVGPGTYLNEILRYCGGENVIKETTSSLYPTIDYEKIIAMHPEVILLFGQAKSALSETGILSREEAIAQGLNLPESVNVKIVLIDHDKAFLPSTSAVSVAEMIAKRLWATQAVK